MTPHRVTIVAFALAAVVVSCGAAEEPSDSPTSSSSGERSATARPTRVPTAVPTPTPDLRDLVPPQPISTYAGTGGPGFSGDGGPAVEAAISGPLGLAIDREGNLYIAADNRVRRVDARTLEIETIAGTGQPGSSGDGLDATRAKLKTPQGVAVDRDGNLYIADRDNGRVRKVDASGVITTVAGGGVPTRTGGILDSGDGGPAIDAWFKHVYAVDVDAEGNLYLLADNRLRMVDPSGTISTLVGTGLRGNTGDGGPGVEAELASPLGVAVDHESKYVYIADTDSQRIRRLELETGVITTIAGQGVPAMGQTLCPIYYDTGTRAGGEGAGFDGDGGPAVDALLDRPGGVAVGPNGNVYIADTANDRVRMIDLATGIISTVADGGLIEGRVPDSDPVRGGNLTFAYAYFGPPSVVVINDDGAIFIADTKLNRVVVLRP